MELETGLYRWASAQAAFFPILKPGAGEFRLHKMKIPQGGPTPATVQQRVGTDYEWRACEIDGAVQVSLQLDHYAKTTDERDALAAAWRRALNPRYLTYPVWMGDGDSPSTAVKVKAAKLDNEFDSDDIEPGLQRRTQLWTFWIFDAT